MAGKRLVRTALTIGLGLTAWLGAGPALGAVPTELDDGKKKPLVCKISRAEYKKMESQVAAYEKAVQAAEAVNKRGLTPRGLKAMTKARAAQHVIEWSLTDYNFRCEPYGELVYRKQQAKQTFEDLTTRLAKDGPEAKGSQWRSAKKDAEKQRRKIRNSLSDPGKPVSAIEGWSELDQVLWTFGTFYRGPGGGRYRPCVDYLSQSVSDSHAAKDLYTKYLRKRFQKDYAAKFAQTRLNVDGLAAEVEAAVGAYSSQNGKATWRQAQRPATDLVFTVWPELIREMGINLRQSLALAYPLDNSGTSGLEAPPPPPVEDGTGGGTGDVGKWVESSKTIRAYGPAVKRVWAGIIALAKKDLAQGGKDKYFQYVELLPELVRRLGTGWPEYGDLVGAIRQAAEGNAELQKQVSRYEALTGRLLRWRAEAGKVICTAALGPGAPKPQPGPDFLKPETSDGDLWDTVGQPWETDVKFVWERFDRNKVRVPNMRLFRDSAGKTYLRSPWMGRGLFLMPIDEVLAGKLKAADQQLAGELATGTRSAPMTPRASVAAGTCGEGPFPAVVGEVATILSVPFIYALAEMSTEETILDEVRLLPRPGNAMYAQLFFFILEPVCVQTRGEVVRP